MRKKSSQYYGVHWRKANRKWAARISVKGEQINVGSFSDEREAARMVDIALIKHNIDPRNFKWTKKIRG